MKIGLICAIEEESLHILREMEIIEKDERLKTSFYKGKFLGKDIVFVVAGMGKVSVALCTQILIGEFDVDLVLFSGIAGGLNPNLTIGDTIIGTEVLFHDVNRAGEGINMNDFYSVFRNRFKADQNIIKKLQDDLIRDNLPIPFALQSLRQGKEMQIIFGRILTGDQVITSRVKSRQLWRKFAGDCVEMEGAAVAQTCFLNDRLFLIIRTISDLADEDAMIIIKDSIESVNEVNYQILQEVIRLL
ncbi:MAG: 5'-methylthioadenosine/adenosylhomocysteine nucleosidase [Halanaerobiales bacterium]|nr:5'-methylthioadenosine/adenosylhomocysteine nucleosidase [Halanaerobiales bacterium]